MKKRSRISVAIWLLEHCVRGAAGEALVGDLVEQWQEGRPARWFWREALIALAVCAGEAALRWVPAALFAAGWSLLYPFWRAVGNGWLPREIPQHWLALAWPWPQLMELGYGATPAVSFVWLGALVYLLVRRGHLRGLTAWRVVGGLSASLNALFGSALAILQLSEHRDLVNMTHVSFFVGYQIMGISAPLTLSVLAALVAVSARGPRVARGQRAEGPRATSRFARLVHGASHGVTLASAQTTGSK